MYGVNQAYYDAPETVAKYTQWTDVYPAEESIIGRYRDEIARARFLEIGVGPGRTTPVFKSLVRQYVGIDYSAAMLAPCRQRFHGTQLLLADARSLAFRSDSFDAVYFSWNAIDDAGHADRLAILADIARVLRRGGLFAFSSHNREWKAPSAFRTFPGSLEGYFRGIYNHLRHRKYERDEDEYAIVNEAPLEFRTLTYFIDRRRQIDQLARYGFGDVEMFGGDGLPLTPDEPCTDGWIFYAARNRG